MDKDTYLLDNRVELQVVLDVMLTQIFLRDN